MDCFKCGHSIAESDRYCPQCGLSTLEMKATCVYMGWPLPEKSNSNQSLSFSLSGLLVAEFVLTYMVIIAGIAGDLPSNIWQPDVAFTFALCLTAFVLSFVGYQKKQRLGKPSLIVSIISLAVTFVFATM